MTEGITGNARKNFEKDNYFIKKSVTNSIHTENSGKILKSKNQKAKPKLKTNRK